MPPETEETVGTWADDVPLAAIDTSATGEDATSAGADTQLSGDGEAQPQAQPIKIGDADYTLQQIQEVLERDKNIREFRRTADERHKAAAQLEREFYEKPEIRKLQFLMDQIQQNPNIRAEFDAVTAALEGRGQMQAQNAQLLWRVQSLEERLKQTEDVRDTQSASEIVDNFLALHNSIPGEPKWDRNSGEFEKFYNEFEKAVEPSGPFGADLEAYFWKTRGPELLQSVTAAASKQGAEKVVETLQRGREAARSEVPAAGHEAVPYEPDMTDPTLEPEIQAAYKDASILPGLR